MKDVIICGKANIGIPVEALRKGDAEFWMLGTDEREGADKYFELHGIKVEHENTFYELPDEVYNQGLPVNNSISALLVYAVLSGYTNISIVGAPMNARDEYIRERPALAFLVGYFAANNVVHFHLVHYLIERVPFPICHNAVQPIRIGIFENTRFVA